MRKARALHAGRQRDERGESVQSSEASAGLYFSLTDPNKAFINLQHPASGVDHMIEIRAVPEPGTDAMLLDGLASLGFMACRRQA